MNRESNIFVAARADMASIPAARFISLATELVAISTSLFDEHEAITTTPNAKKYTLFKFIMFICLNQQEKLNMMNSN